MAKKKYEVDVEKMKKTLWYRVSKFITDISIPVLYILAIGFALFRGVADKQNAAIYSEMSVLGADAFMKKLVEVSLLSTFCLYGINTFAKSARLNSINKAYLEYFELALRSKITDIQRLKPERILGCAANIATMKADIKSVVIDMVRAVIPFAVIIYSIAKMSLFWAIVMVIVMGGAITMDLLADKIFHFDSQKSELKSEMSAVSTAQYTAITMLKYMNAERWSLERLHHAQKEAIPAMQGCNKQLYGIIMYALTIAPEIICMYNAMRSGDATLATYLAFNLNSVYWMINLLTGLAETKSELDGELNTMNDLHGDDIPYEKKPAFPEKLRLKDIKFYYESDEDKKKPFIFENLVLQRGKRYRFVGPSGSGKSSAFRFFAGEMVSDYNCDFRVFYIHQEAKLLNFATLRENITLGNPWVPDGDIEALLDDLRMGQWLRNLPKGLDSVVGKDINPSGGESSRISLMRAFIHVRNYTSDVMHRERNTSDLILMDEVTSALDKRTEDLGADELCTEEAVIKVIDREFRGCTVLIISHEDESSSAFGMRHIVDYKVKLRVVQEGDLEKHIFGEPLAVKHQKTIDITPVLTKVSKM